MNAGGRPQRLLMASTGTKDPKASDILYVKALAAPFTVNTMPEATLKAFADHGEVGALMGRRRRLRGGAGGVRAGRDRCPRRGQAAGGGRRVVREVLERHDGGDRFEVRGAREGRLKVEKRSMKVLAVDIGGTYVKILAAG